jgi:hypothetical protein
MRTDRPADRENRLPFPSGEAGPVHRAWRRGRAARCQDAVLSGAAAGFWMGLRLLWGLVRAFVVAVLVLFEPVLRCILVPVAFLSFLVTLVFGVLMQAPNFPVWGMLVFSVAMLWAYWLYVAVLSMFLRGGRGRD